MKNLSKEHLKLLLQEKLIFNKDNKVNLENSNIENSIVDYLYELEQEKLFFKDQLNKLQIVVDTTPCTISWVNDKLTYLGVNKTLCEIADMKADDFKGQQIGFNTTDKYFVEFTKKLFASDQETIYEELESHFGEETKYFWVVGTKFHIQSEAVVIGIETTQLKKLEERLRFSEKMSSLGEMAAGIAHEINNPLTFISLKAAQLKKKFEDEKLLEVADKIETTVKRISKIIHGLKNFSRDSEKDPFIPTDINQIIDESIEICTDKIKKNKVKVEFEKSDQSLLIDCKESQLSQVFVNLVSNGVDAVSDKDNKWINIKLEDNKESIKAIITDAGQGIPLDIQDKILQPFFTTKDIGKGTGLGLSISKGIIEKAHKGHFFIDNDKPNTTFVIELPKKH